MLIDWSFSSYFWGKFVFFFMRPWMFSSPTTGVPTTSHYALYALFSILPAAWLAHFVSMSATRIEEEKLTIHFFFF